DMIARSDRADMIDAKLPKDPIENADAEDPIEPIDSTDPIEPMDRTEFLQPMHSREFSDRIDHLAPAIVGLLGLSRRTGVVSLARRAYGGQRTWLTRAVGVHSHNHLLGRDAVPYYR